MLAVVDTVEEELADRLVLSEHVEDANEPEATTGDDGVDEAATRVDGVDDGSEPDAEPPLLER